MTVQAIFISPGHRFFGRHGLCAAGHDMVPVAEAECVAGSGLRGDRFFDYRPDYKGQVTLFSGEVLDELRQAFQRPELPAAALRRNVLVRGFDLGAAIGRSLLVQGIELEAVEECRPCYWMDSAVGPGAEAWLRGRGGLRCRIRTGGWLRAAFPL